MTTLTLARLAGASILTLALAGCMDVDMTIDVTSETDAEATMVTSLAADIYQMIWFQMARAWPGSAPAGAPECWRGRI